MGGSWALFYASDLGLCCTTVSWVEHGVGSTFGLDDGAACRVPPFASASASAPGIRVCTLPHRKLSINA